MTCQELAAKFESLQPEAPPRDVARLCLLLTNFADDLPGLNCDQDLARPWRDMGLRLQAATDQHAAMTEELEQLADSDPANFSADEVHALIRAIKVQNQVLQLYIGQPQMATVN